MRAVHQGLRGLAGAICGLVASACSGQLGLLSFLEQAEGEGLARGRLRQGQCGRRQPSMGWGAWGGGSLVAVVCPCGPRA